MARRGRQPDHVVRRRSGELAAVPAPQDRRDAPLQLLLPQAEHLLAERHVGVEGEEDEPLDPRVEGRERPGVAPVGELGAELLADRGAQVAREPDRRGGREVLDRADPDDLLQPRRGPLVERVVAGRGGEEPRQPGRERVADRDDRLS